MQKYLILYYATPEAVERMKNIPKEEKQDSQNPRLEWMKMCGEAIVDFGGPLGKTQKITLAGISDANNPVMGYTIMQANTIEEIQELMADNPFFAMGEGFSVDVSEIVVM